MLVFSFISIYNKSYDSIIEKVPSNYEINKDMCSIKDNIKQTVNIASKLFWLILLCGNKIDIKVNKYAQTYPADFTILFEIMKYLVKQVYRFIKQKKHDMNLSDEIMRDRKRTLKYIENEVNDSIQKEFNSKVIDGIFFSNFRIINRKSVKVKTNDKEKAPVIYKLNLGHVVTEVDKRREWTKIKFYGEDNCTYIGWVFTRYISKFH